MTYDRRTDSEPVDPVAPVDNETRVVERETYVERERPVAEPAAGPVNVNAASRGYAEPAGPGPLALAGRIVSLLFGILAVLLGLRILLLLLVANQTNAIVDFVYNVTEPFVAPFRGIFAMDVVTPGGGSVFDVAALVSLVGWLLIYLLIMAIIRLGSRDRVSVA
jgi:uncharacterized protein YggT (Ycf19 family)